MKPKILQCQRLEIEFLKECDNDKIIKLLDVYVNIFFKNRFIQKGKSRFSIFGIRIL